MMQYSLISQHFIHIPKCLGVIELCKLTSAVECASGACSVEQVNEWCEPTSKQTIFIRFEA